MTTFDMTDAWLLNDLNTDDWNSITIAASLNGEVLNKAVELYPQLPFTVKKGLLFSILSIKRGDFYPLKLSVQQFIQLALEDPNDFIRSMANVMAPFPEELNWEMDSFCRDFKSALSSIGANIKEKGLTFHSKEDRLLHFQARTVPTYAAPTYAKYTPAENTPSFNLATDPDDEFSAKARHARFAEMVAFDERASARNPQARRPSIGSGLPSISTTAPHARSGIRPHGPISPPAPMPPSQRPLVTPGQRPTMMMPNQRPPMPRRTSSGTNLAAQSSLFNKRAAKPIAGNLFSPKKPTVQNRQASLSLGRELPKGLQREKRVQMIDFNDATAMQQNAADAIRKAKEEEKLEKLAKRQEAMERKRQRGEEEKQAMDEAKAKKAAAKKAKSKTTSKRRKQSTSEGSSEPTNNTTTSPTASAPTSPTSPTSPQTPITSPGPLPGVGYPFPAAPASSNGSSPNTDVLPSINSILNQGDNDSSPQQQQPQQARRPSDTKSSASPKMAEF